MKAKQNILFGTLFFVIMMSMLFLWKPWGSTVVWGLCGILFLRQMIVIWRKAKMIYLAISYAVWVITSLILFVQSLIMHNVSWSWMVVFAPFVMLIMTEVERRKNPDKVKKYESAWKNVSFFKLLWFHITDLEDKEKPENKEK